MKGIGNEDIDEIMLLYPEHGIPPLSPMKVVSIKAFIMFINSYTRYTYYQSMQLERSALCNLLLFFAVGTQNEITAASKSAGPPSVKGIACNFAYHWIEVCLISNPSDRPFQTLLFSNPQVFLRILRELQCNTVLMQQLSGKQLIF